MPVKTHPLRQAWSNFNNRINRGFHNMWCRTLYRPVMRLMHRFNLHYAPPSPMSPIYGERDHWCQWCGLRGKTWRVDPNAGLDIPTFPPRYNPTEKSLCGVPYLITEQDGQFIFEEKSGFYGVESRFVLEWKGCGWYLVGYEGTFGTVFVKHIAAALEWVEANCEIRWTNGTGVVVPAIG